jgi:hypothetical protein
MIISLSTIKNMKCILTTMKIKLPAQEIYQECARSTLRDQVCAIKCARSIVRDQLRTINCARSIVRDQLCAMNSTCDKYYLL